MDSGISKTLKDFSDYSFSCPKETALVGIITLTAKYEALRDLVIEHLSVTTSLNKEELFAELDEKADVRFHQAWADFVLEFGHPPSPSV